jgi:murein L,D-transpeptidase YafK
MTTLSSPSWKTAIRLLLIGLAGILLLAVLPLFDGRLSAPPDPEGAGIRAVLLASDGLDAREYAPGLRRLCQLHLDSALRELNRQRSLFWIRRNYRAARFYLTTAEAETLRMYREVRSRLEADRESAAGINKLLEEELARVRALFRHAATESVIRQHLAVAEMKYKAALDLYGQGRYSAALLAGRQSLDALAAVKDRSLAVLARYNDEAMLAQWKAWIDQAVRASRSGRVAVVVIKEQHRLDLYKSGALVRSMPVDLGAGSLYQKMREGDRSTPEGRYRVTKKKGYGASIFGLALLIDYPNAADWQRFREARKRGEIPAGAAIGGLIEIHGRGGRGYDWTDGCVAPSDDDMRWLFQQVPPGTSVIIVGSDGTDGPIRTSIKENSHDSKGSETGKQGS